MVSRGRREQDRESYIDQGTNPGDNLTYTNFIPLQEGVKVWNLFAYAVRTSYQSNNNDDEGNTGSGTEDKISETEKNPGSRWNQRRRMKQLRKRLGKKKMRQLRKKLGKKGMSDLRKELRTKPLKKLDKSVKKLNKGMRRRVKHKHVKKSKRWTKRN